MEHQLVVNGELCINTTRGKAFKFQNATQTYMQPSTYYVTGDMDSGDYLVFKENEQYIFFTGTCLSNDSNLVGIFEVKQVAFDGKRYTVTLKFMESI